VLSLWEGYGNHSQDKLPACAYNAAVGTAYAGVDPVVRIDTECELALF
jgi:hypothetical protein